MSVIRAEQLLQQMQALSRQAQTLQADTTDNDKAHNFQAFLQQSLTEVDNAQHNSSAIKQAFETGQASLADVMIAGQKAELGFQGVLQVRNKLLKAYEEIMNLPL